MKQYAGLAILGIALLIAWFGTQAQLQGLFIGVGLVVLAQAVLAWLAKS